MHLIHRNTCRVCHSPSLTPVIDLGSQYLQNVFLKKGLPAPPKRNIPLSLVFCNPAKDENACGLLQTEYTVPPKILYSTYWYRSGTNKTMRDHLRSIAQTAVMMIRKKNARVLDIGCNDGTLLYSYPATYKKYGIDPSNAVLEIKRKDIQVVKDTFPSAELKKKMGRRTFDIITSIAMFYDIEDPISFVEQVKHLLSPSGIWIFEVFYMPDMLPLTAYDTICHEHLSYYSLAVLEYIVSRAGMKIIRVSKNDINGSTIRCFVTHVDNFNFKKYESAESLHSMRQEEFDLGLDNPAPYLKLQEKILKHREELSGLLKKLKRAGKRIHTYGASTKGNTLLQFCGLDNSIIDYAADRNPEKDGAMTLGTNIPIISEEKSRAMKPDYYLVLPWAFRDEFLQREKTTMEKGTGMIFPFPTVEIVESGNL